MDRLSSNALKRMPDRRMGIENMANIHGIGQNQSSPRHNTWTVEGYRRRQIPASASAKQA
eukprot:690683-Pelagomonas_calceolata.AAC.1